MKTSLTLLAGLIIGLIVGIFLNPVYSGITSIKEKARHVQTTDPCDQRDGVGVLSTEAIGIELEDAWKMFDDYHGVTNNTNSRACMTTTVKEGGVTTKENIESIYLPYEGFLKIIKCRVEKENETFLGLAGVPAYNSDPKVMSYSMIWIPVVADDDGNKEYFIPQVDASKFIFEYVGICPEDCPTNRCDIWKEDWDVNDTDVSMCPENQ